MRLSMYTAVATASAHKYLGRFADCNIVLELSTILLSLSVLPFVETYIELHIHAGFLGWQGTPSFFYCCTLPLSVLNLFIGFSNLLAIKRSNVLNLAITSDLCLIKYITRNPEASSLKFRKNLAPPTDSTCIGLHTSL